MHFNIAQLACERDSRRILAVLRSGPRSVKEMAHASGISLTRCYRLVKHMEELNLVRHAPGAGRESFYISNLRSLEMALEGERLSFNIEFLDGTVSESAIGPDELAGERPAPQDVLAASSRDGSTVA